jgi:uncharacterized cupin superfamily protein
MTPAAISSTRSAVKLDDSPIPAAVITQGQPVAKTWVAAQSDDQLVTQGVWECTAGKFNWDYGWDEFVMVLEGEAIITPENRPSFALRVGDFGYFPLGLKVEWHVPSYIRKTFVIRTPDPLKF